MKAGVGREWGEGRGVRLHVGGLGLDRAQVQVFRRGDLVVVKLAVLGRGAVHPHRALGALDEHPTAVVDIDLPVVGKVEFVVRDPEPGVFHVDARFRRHMEHQERPLARGVGGGGHGRVFGAGVRLEPRARGSANSPVHVPYPRRTLRGSGEVPFEKHGAGLGALGRE